MELIIMLVDYLNQQKERKSITLLDFNDTQVNIVSTKIIMWIRAEYKRYLWAVEGKKNLHHPLELNYCYDWCNDIKRLVEEDVRFSRVFVVTNNNFDFNLDLDENEKIEILKYVGKNLKNYVVL